MGGLGNMPPSFLQYHFCNLFKFMKKRLEDGGGGLVAMYHSLFYDIICVYITRSSHMGLFLHTEHSIMKAILSTCMYIFDKTGTRDKSSA